MRSLVQPLPTRHCKQCNGELLLKSIEPSDPAYEVDVEIYVCKECGCEHSRRMIHDPYTPHISSGLPRRTVG